LKACEIKTIIFANIYIIAIYRAPSGYFKVFMDGLDSIIKQMNK